MLGFIISVLMIITMVTPAVAVDLSGAWERLSAGGNGENAESVAVSSLNPDTIYVGTGRQLIQSKDGGKTFHPIFHLLGSEEQVNDIYIEEGSPAQIYAATNDGVFVIDNRERAGKIFQNANSLQRKCLAVLKSGGAFYIGTEGGMFIRGEGTSDWSKMTGKLGGEAIHLLKQDARYVYAATAAHLYRIEKVSGVIKEIYSAGTEAEEETENVSLDATDEEGASSQRKIKDVVVREGEHPIIVLVGEQGILESMNAGETWEPFAKDGFSFDSISSLVLVEDAREANGADGAISQAKDLILLAATDHGVYAYQNQQWYPIYKGMENNSINKLAVSNKRVLAATNAGIFALPFFSVTGKTVNQEADRSAVFADYQSLSKYFSDEPMISDVQRMAVRYAEVHPDKIRNWRKEARVKALLPSVSAGINRSEGEFLHWDTGPNPDRLRKGQDNLDWDVSVSWDFADLVWSTDQTTIDSRSKLMVELREDVLDQVTRLYFERRRLQMELLTRLTEDDVPVVEKEMRIEELTALLDGFTGGQFSSEIQNNLKSSAQIERSEIGRRL